VEEFKLLRPSGTKYWG